MTLARRGPRQGTHSPAAKRLPGQPEPRGRDPRLPLPTSHVRRLACPGGRPSQGRAVDNAALDDYADDGYVRASVPWPGCWDCVAVSGDGGV